MEELASMGKKKKQKKVQEHYHHPLVLIRCRNSLLLLHWTDKTYDCPNCNQTVDTLLCQSAEGTPLYRLVKSHYIEGVPPPPNLLQG